MVGWLVGWLVNESAFSTEGAEYSTINYGRGGGWGTP